MTDAFDQRQAFLRAMSQFDEHDLDFGIYKVPYEADYDGADTLNDYLHNKPASGESQGKPIFNDIAAG